MTIARLDSFHAYQDSLLRPFQVYQTGTGWSFNDKLRRTTTERRSLSYQFFLHAHPYVPELVEDLIQGSVKNLEDADTQQAQKADGSTVYLTDAHGQTQTLADGTPIPRPALYEEPFSSAAYAPSSLVFNTADQPYPVKDLDFTTSGAYAAYNWELFFHIPLAVAIHLSQNQRYEDAEQWFRYIFDPTDASDGPTPQRFWKVAPFRYSDVQLIENILVNLSTGADPQLQQDTINTIADWKNNPFQPYAVARHRPTAFMFKAVMAYFDHHLAWADGLFAQYTGETINDAMQHFILVAHLLGPRPQAVPKKGSVRPQTYANLRSDLSAFGDALVDLETALPFDTGAPPPHTASERLKTLASIGRTLYFCVPRNDHLLQYWDTVADRLFKIRNSLNIEGIFQQVPLFEPPIDPALLVRAAASGLDVGAIVSGLNQPLPLVRFQYLVQKASEICQEVKALGNAMLSAIEKQDNEALSMLRAQHESAILSLAEAVKYAALQEATKNREGLEQSIANAAARYTYYERLLNAKDIKVPTLDALDKDGLLSLKFQQSEPGMAVRQIDVNIAQSASANLSVAGISVADSGDVTGGKIMSSYEANELALLSIAQTLHNVAADTDTTSSALALLPQFRAHIEPFGAGASIEFGGTELHGLLSGLSSASRGMAGRVSFASSQSGKLGGNDRRQQEWAFQSNTIAGEIVQLFKQLRAAQIREAMAEREWKNHQTQIAQAKDIEQFLQGAKTDNKVKTTTEDFYLWMRRELKGLYAQAFQFAFDVARKAERALQQELGDPSLSYIQFGYLAGKEGLLAGEKLYQDIKRMEIAYADLNRREYELTKHVSLLQLDPTALLQLRATGTCTLTLPEEVFDFDGPGHYFRRIRSVAVTLPCVSGPYTSVNCTLTLLKSSIRTSTLPGSADSNAYMRDGADDPRFSDYFGSMQAIVTSSGQADSGLFETSLRDERKLPFEYSGAISQWQLELSGAQVNPPSGVRQFDYDTIADVILHIRYTAREGGIPLRQLAMANLEGKIANAQAPGSIRLFSMRHDFPTEWAKFTSVQHPSATVPAGLAMSLRPEHYPFWSSQWLAAVLRVDLYAEYTGKPKTPRVSYALDANGAFTGPADTLASLDTTWPGWAGGQLAQLVAAKPAPTGQWSMYLDDNTMSDLFMVVTWGKPAQ